MSDYDREDYRRDEEDNYASDDDGDTKEDTTVYAHVAKRGRFEEAGEVLSILAHRESIMKAIESHPVVVIVGETGSGKSTQIPQFLYTLRSGSDNKGHIAVTQPRRVAAIALCKRVASEMKVVVGREVGYSVRFDDCTSEHTTLRYMTDGILVREALSDPLLSKYSLIMLDEVHERSIHTDILLGLLKSLLRRRKDLRLILTSATLNTHKFADFFDNCPVVEVPGRVFPVDIFHAKAKVTSQTRHKLWEQACEIVMKIHHKEPAGDVLVFLPGSQDIDNAASYLRTAAAELPPTGTPSSVHGLDMIVVPLYGALSSEKQQVVFHATRAGERKVVLATNIAETSLTVAGVKYVVDPGYVKQKLFKGESGIEILETVLISKTSAQQRAGRAGRTSAGKCFRLYPSAVYDDMEDVTVPEIKRSNLSNTVLYLKVLGIEDILSFDFLDRPQESALIDALASLHYLGALDADGRITSLGSKMSEFPLDPSLSRMLLASVELHCAEEAIICSAMLSVENVFYQGSEDRRGRRSEAEEKVELRRKSFMHEYGDHITFINIFREFVKHGSDKKWCEDHGLHFRALRQACSIQKQLEDIMTKAGYSISSDCSNNFSALRQALCRGYFVKSAKKVMNATYKSLADGKAPIMCQIHPTATLTLITANPSLLPSYVVYHELVYTNKAYLRHATSIKYSWIEENLYRMESVDMNRLCLGKINMKLVGDRFRFGDVKYNTEKTTSSGGVNSVDNKSAVQSFSSSTADAVAQARARFMQRKKQ
jgi:HrpA-like RNA helicase